ncbi:MAG: Dam family site-specific DNA-(adenine-N6)-methyltransferase [Treponema sp.]|nr:Dam family site-specific DNA-(adenine-N6)-methyltransferase [Treponema sp.]
MKMTNKKLVLISSANIRRSPFFYVGDKYKLVPQLKENFPKNITRFIEPFCGGGSVFLNVEAKKYLLNDIDSNMIILHKYFISQSKKPEVFWDNIKKAIENYCLSATFLGRDVPQILKKEHKKTYFAHYNKEAYYQMRSDYNKEKTNALLLYLLLIYGFNRILRFNSKGDFNLPVGNVDFNANTQQAINNYFLFVANKNINFFSMDFEKFLTKTNPTRDDFVYLDPPYLITFSEYNKLWNEESETRLIGVLDSLNEAGVRFAVSNVLWHRARYNDIFNEWAQKYNIVRIKSNYISFNDNTEKNTYEVLIKNY